MDYFSKFYKTFNKACVKFLRVWTKNTIIGNSENIFESFSKIFLRKLLKMHYLSIFFKRFNKPCVNFSRVWTKNEVLGNFEKNLKIFDENAIEKLNIFIFYFFENLLLKIEPSEIPPFFYNNFFSVSGGGHFPLSPLATPLMLTYI